MSKPVNAFTNAREYNAIYPWTHEIDPFCICTRCHAIRRERILNKCNVILEGIEMLEWPNGIPATLASESTVTTDPTVLRSSRHG